VARHVGALHTSTRTVDPIARVRLVYGDVLARKRAQAHSRLVPADEHARAHRAADGRIRTARVHTIGAVVFSDIRCTYLLQ
jgi:hypothetical protein